MSLTNSVRLMGRITRDLEVKTNANNKVVGRTAIAVQDNYQGADKQWVEKTIFVNLVIFGEKNASYNKQKLSKGNLVLVEGELDISSYTAQDGNKKEYTSVKLSSVRVIDRKGSGNQGNANNSYNPAQDFANQSYQAPAQDNQIYDPSDFGAMEDDGDIPF